ncbi:DUF4386 domain-containing protein [Nocardioides ungokensis]|uniref:DUF4386 domain-containing protein n=1 Tax=Nocardioides ungokensis TaxID=1643322 RepID=UPI0015DFB858|nr:DUF4386 domain-containing protein [Nocardioides ungokensis]
MTTRKTGRIVGALILAGFLYGGGSFLIASATGTATPVPENATSLGKLSAGAVLLLLNSVAAIGVLVLGVLRRDHRRTAHTYLVTRTVEGVLLALAPLGMLTLVLLDHGGARTSSATDSGLAGLARTAAEHGQSAYWVAMAALGVGSIFFCAALLRSGLLPRLLAVWGVVGYAVFAFGSVLELAGYGVGLALSVPGGLFELTAGIFLVVKGFRQTMPQADDAPRSGSSAAVVWTVSGAGT